MAQACDIVASNGNEVSVYNLPLCWLDPRVLPHYVNSISDWKNDYMPKCESCAAGALCGGFFSSNLNGKITEEMITPFKLSEFVKFKSASS